MTQNAALKLTQEEEQRYLILAEKFEQSGGATIAKKRGRPKTKEIPDFDVHAVVVSDHGYQRLADRFGIKKTQGLQFVRDTLERAIYIGETVDEIGSRTHMFAAISDNAKHLNLGIHLSLDLKCVVTVLGYTNPHPMIELMKEKVFAVYLSEIKKLCRKERQCLDKIEYIIAEANAEIYPLIFESMKTKSQARKDVISERLTEIDVHVAAKRQEIVDLQERIRVSTRSLMTVM